MGFQAGHNCINNNHHPQTGMVYLLVSHQAIYAPSLDHHLLCPMQCWLNHVWINETPKLLTDNPDESLYAIIVNDPSGKQDMLIIPLMLNGVTGYFPVQQPTLQEWEDENNFHLDIKHKVFILTLSTKSLNGTHQVMIIPLVRLTCLTSRERITRRNKK